MKNVPSFKRFAWLFTLVGLLIGTGGHSGLFLCFGPDGHVAVESSSSGRCGSSPEKASHPLQVLQTVETKDVLDDCGPCVDFPILVFETINQQTAVPFQKLVEQAFTTILPVNANGFVSPVPHKILPHSRPFHNPLLDSRRTIVLLI